MRPNDLGLVVLSIFRLGRMVVKEVEQIATEVGLTAWEVGQMAVIC